MVNKIVELYQQELHIYSGNYDYYEKKRPCIEQQQKPSKISRIISASRNG